MKPEAIKLGYLAITSPVPNVYIGGLMVTDHRGLPLEFRYSEPIHPTKIQQVLYGQVLSQYIKREVILDTLLKSIEHKFKCLLVEDEHMLEIPAKGYSILRISETKSPPLGEVGKSEEIGTGELLLQTTPEGSPVRIQFSPADLSAGNGESEEGAGPARKPYEILVEAGAFMDVQEPMKRVNKALEIICQEAGITSQTS